MQSSDSGPSNEPHSFDERFAGTDPYLTPWKTVDRDATEVTPQGLQPAGIRQRIAGSNTLMWLLVAVTTFGSVCLFFLLSVVASVAAMLITNDGSLPAVVNEEVIANLMQNRIGFVLSVMVPQFALLVLPILACFLLPAGPRKSLRLVRGNWPVWGWFAAAAATPMVGTLASMLMGPFIEESESLKAMSDAFRHHAQSGFLIPLLLIIGVTPSICEEVMFRGFLQPRLTKLMPPFAGVLLASLAFAIMHIDPIHVLGVLPLGIWLGFLSYKSQSLFPAMLGHLINNVLSVVSVIPEDAGVFDAPDFVLSSIIFGIGVVGLIGVGIVVFRHREDSLDAKPQQSTDLADA